MRHGAYLKQPVYARDTATDPLWENCGGIAMRNGLRAIWSTPILSEDERVLGTFAMYYGAPRLPSDEHILLIDMAVQMARVAIGAKEDDEFVRVIFANSPRAVVITDLQSTILHANRAFALELGYLSADLRGKAMTEITADENPASLAELLASDKEVLRDRRYRARDARVLWARERSSVRRDADGEARYVVTLVEKMSESGEDPLERLSRRERQVLEAVVAGKPSKEIAADLGVSAASVDTYRSRIMLKLGVADLPALLRFAIRRGIASV